jgi:uncharacterized Rmd1/YagE family protein
MPPAEPGGGAPVFGPGKLRARALLLAVRLDLRSWPEAETLGRMPLAVRLPEGGVAVLFRFGVAVLFGASARDEAACGERLAPLMAHRYPRVESEELELRIDPARAEGLQDGALHVRDGGLERLQLIADALAKSALLAHYEARFAAEFDRIEPLALELAQQGRISGGTREHLKRLGALLLVEQRMVGRAEIGEKPELLWEHPELERLHALLEAEFEIPERLDAIERKLDLAAGTARSLVEVINTRHALRVEWYIVALIVFEILLSLYQMWRA